MASAAVVVVVVDHAVGELRHSHDAIRRRREHIGVGVLVLVAETSAVLEGRRAIADVVELRARSADAEVQLHSFTEVAKVDITEGEVGRILDLGKTRP